MEDSIPDKHAQAEAEELQIPSAARREVLEQASDSETW